MHKPTIHCKIPKSSFLHHNLTELLLITTMFFFFPYDLLFSSYTAVSVIQLKMYTSRNVHFRFHIRTLFTNSPRTNHFVFDESYRVHGPNFTVYAIYDINAKLTNCVLYAIFARTENLHFAVNGRFMHRRSHIVDEHTHKQTLLTHTNKHYRLTLHPTMKGKGKQKMTAVLADSKTIISVLTMLCILYSE